MEKSPLARLSAELRNEIWALILVHDKPFKKMHGFCLLEGFADHGEMVLSSVYASPRVRILPSRPLANRSTRKPRRYSFH